MTEQQKEALRLRAEDLTMEEIAEKMGCTKQNVSLLLNSSINGRNYARTWRQRKVVYPNINKWLIENNMSLSRFAKLCGYQTQMPIRHLIIENGNSKKDVIDAVLRVTGMSYEVAFRKCDEGDEG